MVLMPKLTDRWCCQGGQIGWVVQKASLEVASNCLTYSRCHLGLLKKINGQPLVLQVVLTRSVHLEPWPGMWFTYQCDTCPVRVLVMAWKTRKYAILSLAFTMANWT